MQVRERPEPELLCPQDYPADYLHLAVAHLNVHALAEQKQYIRFSGALNPQHAATYLGYALLDAL